MSDLTAGSRGEVPPGQRVRQASDRLTIVLNASHGLSLINFRGRLIERMLALGHEVHVTAPEFEKVETALRSLGAIPHIVPLAKTGLNPLADIRYFRAIRSLLKTVKGDLSVSYTIKPNIWASLAAGSLGIRCASMVTGLGYAFSEGGGTKARLVGLAARALFRAATAANEVVVFQNPDDEADFIAAGCLGNPGKARRTNGSGVDLDYFSPSALPEQPIFLMIGRLLGAKGVREYGAAALQILSRRSDARFLLVGFSDGGPDSIGPGELDAWIEGGVEYLGPLDDVRPAMRQASVFVLPSYREGTPRSVLEAMAMARPIITTNVPGCRETVVEGSNGLLVQARDPAALAAAMESLIERPDLRAQMGARSLELCRSKYDVDKVTCTLLQHLGLVTTPSSSGEPR